MLGYLTSPIHLCLVLTNQYYGVKYGPVSRKLFLPGLAMLVTRLFMPSFWLTLGAGLASLFLFLRRACRAFPTNIMRLPGSMVPIAGEHSFILHFPWYFPPLVWSPS
ncbi:MAG TPA: hypothetical protein DDZ66_07690 [Firmicutes bacterium]|nr:hypothetical protein [Bacillota bacterium]